MSERQLRRQLAAASLSYRELLDRARRERARLLLSRGELPVSRIALELGFADASSFMHACRRWFACAPSELSRRAAGNG